MPKYEFRCNDTGKHFEVVASISTYDPQNVVSPFTGTANVTRIIRKVRLMRSESARWDRLESGDETALDELDQDDPQVLGRTLRHFGEKFDEDMGSEFHEVIDRLESGQNPAEIEQTMPLGDETSRPIIENTSSEPFL